VSKAEIDDDGLWIEAELSRHSEYLAAILGLVEKGALGWSSGTIGQLAMREGKSIKRWPIVELSLTPTPAEPRTLGVEQLKALADIVPALETLTAEPPAVEAETEPEEPTESQPAAETPTVDIAVTPDDEQETTSESAEDPALGAQSAEPTPKPEDELEVFYAIIGDFVDNISERIGRLLS